MSQKSTAFCLSESVTGSSLKTAYMAEIAECLTAIRPPFTSLKVENKFTPVSIAHKDNDFSNFWSRARVVGKPLTQEKPSDFVEGKIQHKMTFSFAGILFQAEIQAKVSENMISRLLKRKKPVNHSSVFTRQAANQILAGATIPWSDLKEIPSERLISEKTICIEFSKENHTLVVSWVNQVNKLAEEKDLVFTTIIVFANYNELSGKEIAGLREEFDEAGAIFTGFPNGCKNFKEAFAAYKKEVEQLINADALYQTERQKIPTNSLSSL